MSLSLLVFFIFLAILYLSSVFCAAYMMSAKVSGDKMKRLKFQEALFYPTLMLLFLLTLFLAPQPFKFFGAALFLILYPSSITAFNKREKEIRSEEKQNSEPGNLL